MAKGRRVSTRSIVLGIVAITAIVLIAGNAIGLPIPDFLGVSQLLIPQTPSFTSTIYNQNVNGATILNGETTEVLLIGNGTGELPPVETTNQTASEAGLILITEVVKIDSSGTEDIDRITFEFGQLAFVEEDTAIDYSSGSIEIRSMEIRGDPNVEVSGLGTFDVLIANQTIFTMPHSLEIDTTTGRFDDNGTARILFVDPTGSKSPTFTFSFTDNLMSFPDFALTELKFVITDFVITVTVCPTCDSSDTFGLIGGELLTLVMNSDPSKTVIVDETTGENIVVDKADNNLVISTIAKDLTGDCVANPPMGDVFIGIVGEPVEDRVQVFSAVGPGVRIPDISDPPTGEVLCSNSSPTAATTLIQRNTDYELIFLDPGAIFTISTPRTQMDYSFSCQYTDATKSTRACNFPPCADGFTRDAATGLCRP